MAYDAVQGFKFGADPELFIVDADGKPVSAAGIIPGTKEEPFKVKCGAVQRDGMAAEFNIDPVSSFEDFNRNIVTVLGELKRFLPKGMTLAALPAVVFPEDAWDAAPDDAKELGCNPDYNAWTGQVNPPPSDPENPRLRTASGHLHIGWGDGLDVGDASHKGHCEDLVKQLDWYLGAWSVEKDKDATRRRLYGQAGAYRPKSYGCEYRVLSNFWVMDKALRLVVWNRMQQAINDMRRTFFPDYADPIFNKMLVDCINSSTMDKTLMAHHKFPIQYIDRY